MVAQAQALEANPPISLDTGIVEAAEAALGAIGAARTEIGRVIFGQQKVVDLSLITLLAGGHGLLVGVPGLAKTKLVEAMGNVLGMSARRVQFTPDLMPSDILGSEVLDESADGKRHFRFIKGPVFAQLLMADEINRASPRTQSALLQSMQEKHVTVAGKRYDLPAPFHVLATQNPLEQEGTYPLPEAQLDRFMFNILLTYPSFAEEVSVVKNTTNDEAKSLSTILTSEDIIAYQHLVRKVPVPDNVIEYAVTLAGKTRPQTAGASQVANDYLEWGAGPRASQFLVLGAKCNALLNGKYSPDIEDVQAIAKPVLRHRIVRNFKAEAEGISVDDIITKLV